jgi:hypothetical protein
MFFLKLLGRAVNRVFIPIPNFSKIRENLAPLAKLDGFGFLHNFGLKGRRPLSPKQKSVKIKKQ